MVEEVWKTAGMEGRDKQEDEMRKCPTNTLWVRQGASTSKQIRNTLR